MSRRTEEELGADPALVRRDLFRIGGVALAGITLGVMPRTEARAQGAVDPVALRDAMRSYGKTTSSTRGTSSLAHLATCRMPKR